MTTITTVLLCIIGMLFGWTLALREEAKQWKVYANKLQKDYIKQLQEKRPMYTERVGGDPVFVLGEDNLKKEDTVHAESAIDTSGTAAEVRVSE